MNIIKCSAQNVDFVESDLTKRLFLQIQIFQAANFLIPICLLPIFQKHLITILIPIIIGLRKTVFSLPDAVSLLSDFDIIIK